MNLSCRNSATEGTAAMQGRVDYIDIYRGIAIILMVMGHVNFGAAFDHYIHAFNMPMWFFISGYFFRDKGWTYRKYIAYRGKRLLLPYVAFGSVHYFYAVLFLDKSQGLVHWGYLKSYLIFNDSGLPLSGAFWFLTAMLVADVLFLVLRRSIRSDKLFAAAIALMAVFGIVFPARSPVRLPWTADASFVALGFYYAGYLTRNHPVISGWYQKYLQKNILLDIPVFLVNAVLIFATPYVNLRTATYPNALLLYFNALTATVLYLSLCFRFSKISLPVIGRVKSILIYIGQNSIPYLCFNRLIITLLEKVLPRGGFFSQTLILVCSMCILSAMTCVILHTPLKRILGK